MRRAFFELLGLAACTVLLVFPVSAANMPSAKPAETAAKTAPAPRSVWPPETVTGKIVSVDPAQNLLIVQADGVPFDMVVRPSTRIESGNEKLTLEQLESDANKTVAVHFVPERSGDIARTIDLKS